ncbi:nucleoside 2-deoxyribosyltransferase [Candidatus Pacearchaeota archaeon]|nr:nucleoside 2-deoxyribosyltransferase [Candidatus Pacearchaeota archaeon]
MEIKVTSSEGKYSLYIASPLGFSEAGRYFLYERLVPLVEKEGFEVLDPWKLTPPKLMEQALAIRDESRRIDRLKEVNKIIGKNNEEAIRKSNGLLAILDGQEVDSGVASEIGFGYALGKLILAYRNDFRLSGKNQATSVNLQVEYFVRASGGVFVPSLSDLERELSALLWMFKEKEKLK